MADRLPRKLAAILYADVVGYSRLTGEDEDTTHRTLSEYLDFVSNTVGSHRGEVMHFAGDAALAKFDAVVDAMTAAVDIQTELNARNQVLPDDQKVYFRIGVNLGDVIEDRGDIYGDGVNLAARLESLADSGGICISDAVRSAIGKKLDMNYEDMGEQVVKNMSEPVRAYKVLLANNNSVAVNPVKNEHALLDKPSIAVLPFTNMSGDPEQEYFSDGITEDIITALSRISGLLVVSRNSTMIYKGQAADVKKVGLEQGVRYVLEGSVRRGGNRVRITAQLIDASTGLHVWADRYDRELTDVFAVQDEITNRIMVEMRVQLKDGEQSRMWAGGTKNVEAWEIAVRANEMQDREIYEDNLEGHRLARQAIELDPGYPRAWVVLGFLHWNDAFWEWRKSRDYSLAKALEAAEKALDLEPEFPDALLLLSHIYRLNGEHDRAVDVALQAIDLAPNHSENMALAAIILTCAGRQDEAVEKFNRAIRLSPLYPAWYLVLFGSCYYSMGSYNQAISVLEKAVSMEPGSAFARIWLCCTFVEIGRLDDARQLAAEVVRIDPGFTATDYQGAIFKESAISKRIVDNLLKAGIPE